MGLMSSRPISAPDFARLHSLSVRESVVNPFGMLIRESESFAEVAGAERMQMTLLHERDQNVLAKQRVAQDVAERVSGAVTGRYDEGPRLGISGLHVNLFDLRFR